MYLGQWFSHIFALSHNVYIHMHMQVFQFQVKSSMHVRKDWVRNFMTCPLTTLLTILLWHYIDSRACLVHTLCVFALCFCYAKTLTRRAKTLGFVHQPAFSPHSTDISMAKSKNPRTHITSIIYYQAIWATKKTLFFQNDTRFFNRYPVSLLYCLMKKNIPT